MLGQLQRFLTGQTDRESSAAHKNCVNPGREAEDVTPTPPSQSQRTHSCSMHFEAEAKGKPHQERNT